MSTGANTAIVRRYLERSVSAGDEAVAEDLVGAGIVFASPYTPELVRGIAGFKRMIVALRVSFPDLTTGEEDVVAAGVRSPSAGSLPARAPAACSPASSRAGAASRSAA